MSPTSSANYLLILQALYFQVTQKIFQTETFCAQIVPIGVRTMRMLAFASRTQQGSTTTSPLTGIRKYLKRYENNTYRANRKWRGHK
jgi:hypothetical protein